MEDIKTVADVAEWQPCCEAPDLEASELVTTDVEVVEGKLVITKRSASNGIENMTCHNCGATCNPNDYSNVERSK